MKKKKIKPCSPVSVQPWKNKRQAIKEIKYKEEFVKSVRDTLKIWW